jgi:hypothetical protein
MRSETTGHRQLSATPRRDRPPHLRLAGLCLALVAFACHGAAQTSAPATSGPVNLLENGDFEQLNDARTLPLHWSTERPDNVRITADLHHGRVIEMTGKKKLMATYGVDLLSETKIPVKPNTRYRCTGYTRSLGPRMMVFVRGYATVTRSIDGERRTFDDAVYTMREEIDPSEHWQSFNLDFDITPAAVFSDHLHKIKYVRVKLWAYWPAGTCWFDDIRFEQVGPLPAEKVRRPDAVTHTDEPARLGPRASQPAAFDEEQTWLDAANAFRAADYHKALPLAEQLVESAQNNGKYRILLARTLASLGRWAEADRHASWFLGDADSQPTRKIEPWQRDWALVVHAQACRHAGRTKEAEKALKRVIRPDASAQARRAAEKLLQEGKQPEP